MDDPGDQSSGVDTCLTRLILPVDLSASDWLDLERYVLVAIVIE